MTFTPKEVILGATVPLTNGSTITFSIAGHVEAERDYDATQTNAAAKQDTVPATPPSAEEQAAAAVTLDVWAGVLSPEDEIRAIGI